MYSLLLCEGFSNNNYCIRSDGLHMHHPVVVALFSHQLFVRADLGNFAGIDHSDDVSILDGGHAMSNDYRSTICECVQGGGSEGVRGREGERKRRNEGGSEGKGERERGREGGRRKSERGGGRRKRER